MGNSCCINVKNNENNQNITIKSEERLRNIKREHLVDFSFEGITTVAKVVGVYDGDTLRVAFIYKDEIIMKSCRLLEINAPEIRNKDKIEKQKAIKSRDYLATITMNDNQLIYVKYYEDDKYGRPLVELFLDRELNENINKKMIKEGHAIKYGL